MYDLLIKGGKLIDPAQGINGQRDVAVSEGKVAAVAAEIPAGKAKKVIAARGKIVCPGLIDLHTHSADAVIMYGVEPDEDGVYSGVTAVCDCGSTGFANFAGLKKLVVPHAKTDMVCFVALHPTGIAFIPEVWSWREVNRDAILKIIADNPGFVKGIKMRAVGALAETLGLELIKTGKKIASEAGVPVMVHIGQDPPEKVTAELMESLTAGVLSVLDKGDILTHLYSPKFGQVIKPDGTP
ncbi:MAG: hypothetical protein Q8O05_03530, partial [Chloroflexota bacterium]|nr:hypothetical protein [Chloroflexota bacterium]